MVSYLVYASALLVPVAGWILLRRNKHAVSRAAFRVLYFLYVRTRLGYMYHLHQLRRSPSSHSVASPLSLGDITVVPVPVVKDNYCYLVIDGVSKHAVLIDPSDASAAKRSLESHGAKLKAILTTHKHWDHSGGNEALKKDFPEVEIYGGAKECVPGATHLLQDKQVVQVGKLMFEAIWTPGHTIGHMVYMLHSSPPCLFTGDHIFIGGTGRMFEQGAEVMLRSLKKITQLPSNSLIFPGHEYTWLNMKFILSLLPTHTPAQLKWQWIKQQRARKLTTVPSVLSEELQYNPFLMPEASLVKDALGLPHSTPPADVLAELRRVKNSYKPL